jgi:hypothetical protein
VSPTIATLHPNSSWSFQIASMSSSLMAVHDQQGLRSDAVALSMTSRMRGGMGLGHVLASREELAHVVSATETELGEDLRRVLRVRGAERVAAERNFQEWAVSTTVVLPPAAGLMMMSTAFPFVRTSS